MNCPRFPVSGPGISPNSSDLYLISPDLLSLRYLPILFSRGIRTIFPSGDWLASKSFGS